jgi:type I restriction enzyme S subunit
MNTYLLLNHFDRITEAPDAIPRLRRFILDLAVRGKLVEQDPNDEPAAELLKRIQKEKIRLVKEGKIKKQEPQPKITDGEIEYELPKNWKLARIGDLLTVIRGASPRPKGDPKYFSTERTPYHWIKISDIRKHSKDRVLCDTDEFLTEAGMQKSVLLPKGTLIVTNSATIGIPIFLGFDGGCVHDGYLAFPYFPTSELSKDFFFVLFQTLQSYAVKKARGMAQLNLNTGLVRGFPLGLPPLAEQHRIVAKVDELMALCDQLEAQLTITQTNRRRLLKAILHQALAENP